MIDPSTNEGIMTPDIKIGREVILVAKPSHDRLRKAMESEVGAHAFSSGRYGESVSFTPVEELLGGH